MQSFSFYVPVTILQCFTFPNIKIELCKIDVTSSNVLELQKGKSRDMSGQESKLAPAREMYYYGQYASLNK